MPPPVKDDVQKELDELDSRMTALKVLYDKYFLGMEKLEPQRERAEIHKTIIELGTRFIRNTGAKFRRDTLKNKFLTYQRFWDRILKQIEEGTYKGHKIKAELHERERAERDARRKGTQPNADANTGEPAPAQVAVNGNGAPRPAPAAPAEPGAPPPPKGVNG